MDSRIETYKHIQTLQAIMGFLIADLQQRALDHDQSKLISPEVEIFDEYTPRMAGSTYGTDEYKGFLAAMHVALTHHYAWNRHHPEHFALNSNRDKVIQSEVSSGEAIGKMNLLDLLEMMSDWKAASMRHADGDIRKSIQINQKRFGYSDEMKQIMLNTVTLLELAVGISPSKAA